LLFISCIIYFVFFFFQAEDGIRDFHVTGVQTCALPILRSAGTRRSLTRIAKPQSSISSRLAPEISRMALPSAAGRSSRMVSSNSDRKSVRVGKEWGSRGTPDDCKKTKRANTETIE